MCFNDVTQILSLEPNSITYGSDTSDGKVGNGERGQNLGKGGLTLDQDLGENIPPERIKRSLLGVRSSASPNCKVSSQFGSSREVYLLQTQQLPGEADQC